MGEVKMEKEPLIYINGEFYPKSEAKISVYDHGFLYGDGVFEGIRVYDGIVFKLEKHIDRLYQSAKAIMLEIPFEKEEMIKAVLETLRKNNFRDAYVRLIVTRGKGDLGLDPRKCSKPTIIIIAEPTIKLVKEEAKEKGITTIISWVRRDPVDGTTHEVKSLNYLNSILAKIEANNAGVDEAIMLTKEGYISEGTAENIFIVKNGKIFTPPTAAGILPGITREVIIELAKKLGIEVVEKNITPYELFTADEAFLTGTAAEILPIREVNKRKIGKEIPGEVTKILMKKFEEIRSNSEEGIPVY
jgi:branched-chain amino acid aminotransferase